MPDPLLLELQETLHREMPITQPMGVRAESWDEGRLAMSMPLDANRNHQFSAFAGSLSTLSTVVGWGSVYLLLRSRGLYGNVVIRRGEIKYREPVRHEHIVARALSMDETDVGHFFDLLGSKGSSKLDVRVEVREGPVQYLRFAGSYVVQDVVERPGPAAR
ncbi:MAG: YiiD C-terminal domain-containing protein [Planctomycetota bacterium]